MENHITQILLAVLVLIVFGKPFYHKLRARERELGGVFLLTHLMNTLKDKGFIIIKLDGEEIRLVEDQTKTKPAKKDA